MSLFIILAIGAVAAYLYLSAYTLVYQGIAALMLMLFLCFFSQLREQHNNALVNNKVFYILFVSLFVVSMSFPLFTSGGWPFLFIALALSLTGGVFRGLVSYMTIVCFVCFISQTDMNTFMFYFICGISVIVLFSMLEEGFKIGIPLILSILIYVVASSCNLLITQNLNLSFYMILVPIIGLFINLVLMLIFLWIYHSVYISRKRETYIDINDPEYPLMQKLKESSENTYQESIHTAYLCNKISSRLGMNSDIVRASGFYLHVGVILQEDTIENEESLLREYAFPQLIIDTIKDARCEKKVNSKEAAVVAMSSLVIRAIMSVLHKQNNAKINYELLISQLFELKLKSHYFDDCNISYKDLNSMKKILIKEDLYYELLH